MVGSCELSSTMESKGGPGQDPHFTDGGRGPEMDEIELRAWTGEPSPSRFYQVLPEWK